MSVFSLQNHKNLRRFLKESQHLLLKFAQIAI